MKKGKKKMHLHFTCAILQIENRKWRMKNQKEENKES